MAKKTATAATTTTTTNRFEGGGWKAVFGCAPSSLAAFRACLGILLAAELCLRFRFLEPFYSDQGTLPLRLLMDKVDDLYGRVCLLHCHFGAVRQQQILLSVQVVAAILFAIGKPARTANLAAAVSWYLYLSLTLRNTWMNYILDRYFHYLLFLSMFLPFNYVGSVDNKARTSKGAVVTYVVTPATVAFKVLVIWIYVDAGYGKWLDGGRFGAQ